MIYQLQTFGAIQVPLFRQGEVQIGTAQVVPFLSREFLHRIIA